MKNYVQKGETLTVLVAPYAALSGAGMLVGAGLFGVAAGDIASGGAGELLTEGVVEIPKTSALAISAGDRLFWDNTLKVVNKTLTAQLCVGVAVSDAANPSPTVTMKLGSYLAAGT